MTQMSDPGDFDRDGDLDEADINALSATVREMSNDVAFDLTDDGLVNQDDRTKWVVELKNTYFGDSNP